MEETFQMSKHDARKPFYANFIRKLIPCVLKKNIKYKLMEEFFQQLLKYLKDQNQQYETQLKEFIFNAASYNDLIQLPNIDKLITMYIKKAVYTLTDFLVFQENVSKSELQKKIASVILNDLICAENDDEDADPIDNFNNYVSKQELVKFASALLKFNDLEDKYSNLYKIFADLQISDAFVQIAIGRIQNEESLEQFITDADLCKFIKQSALFKHVLKMIIKAQNVKYLGILTKCRKPTTQEITNIIGAIWLDACKNNELLLQTLQFVENAALAEKQQLISNINAIQFSELKELKSLPVFIEWSK